MHLGRVKEAGAVGGFLEDARRVKKSKAAEDLDGGNSLLSELVLKWLGEDLAERGPREGMKGPAPEMKSADPIGGYGYEKRVEKE